MNWFPATFTIANGGTTSSVVDLNDYNYGNHSYRVILLVPATAVETISVQVSFDNITFVTLQSGGADVVVPGGKATQLYGIMVRYVRLQSASAVGATRIIPASVSAE